MFLIVFYSMYALIATVDSLFRFGAANRKSNRNYKSAEQAKKNNNLDYL